MSEKNIKQITKLLQDADYNLENHCCEDPRDMKYITAGVQVDKALELLSSAVEQPAEVCEWEQLAATEYRIGCSQQLFGGVYGYCPDCGKPVRVKGGDA